MSRRRSADKELQLQASGTARPHGQHMGNTLFAGRQAARNL